VGAHHKLSSAAPSSTYSPHEQLSTRSASSSCSSRAAFCRPAENTRNSDPTPPGSRARPSICPALLGPKQSKQSLRRLVVGRPQLHRSTEAAGGPSRALGASRAARHSATLCSGSSTCELPPPRPGCGRPPLNGGPGSREAATCWRHSNRTPAGQRGAPAAPNCVQGRPLAPRCPCQIGRSRSLLVVCVGRSAATLHLHSAGQLKKRGTQCIVYSV